MVYILFARWVLHTYGETLATSVFNALNITIDWHDDEACSHPQAAISGEISSTPQCTGKSSAASKHQKHWNEGRKLSSDHHTVELWHPLSICLHHDLNRPGSTLTG